MDPQKSQQLTLSVVNIFLGLEESILSNITDFLSKNDKLLEEDIQSWQIQSLSMLDELTQENLTTIAEEAGISIDAVIEMLEMAGFNAVDEVEGDLKEAAEKGRLLVPPNKEDSAVLKNVILTYASQAKDSFNLVNSTMLQQSKQIYLDIINQTTAKVLSGISTPREALIETASKWAEKGVPALIDKSGRQWSTEGYVNAVLRSMVNNVANDMQEARMDEYDCDLVEISSHMGARPKCAKYQGKIFSRSGKSKKFPSLNSTSIGEPDGLFGINCGHKKYPYIDGITRKTYSPYDEKANKKAYEESQKQRYLEREIRKAKRQLMVVEKLGDEHQIIKAKARVRDKQKKMRTFINNTNRKRDYDREQIVQSSETKSMKTYMDKVIEERKRNEKLISEIKSDLRSGDYNLKYNKGHFDKHDPNHKQYFNYIERNKVKGKQKPSYLTISYEEANALVEKYAGTGKIGLDNKGEWNKKELIESEKVIGIHINQTDGKETPTNAFYIHYSKKRGTHIVPTLVDKDD